MIDIPIIYLSYRRISCCKIVLPIILRQYPRYLYIHSDWNADPSVIPDIIQCRQYIESIDINHRCTLTKIYRSANVMCQGAFRDTINRVFYDGHQMCIVIPQDCVPGDITFQWQVSMLNKYKCTQNIGIIASTNGGPGGERIIPSFFIFGIYKRAGNLALNYKQYKQQINNLRPDSLLAIQSQAIRSSKIEAYKRIINMPSYRGWDIMMEYYLIKNGLYTIYPSSNLVQYIGFQKPTHDHSKCQSLKTWRIDNNFNISK